MNNLLISLTDNELNALKKMVEQIKMLFIGVISLQSDMVKYS
jgi:hypothetical protein